MYISAQHSAHGLPRGRLTFRLRTYYGLSGKLYREQAFARKSSSEAYRTTIVGDSQGGLTISFNMSSSPTRNTTLDDLPDELLCMIFASLADIGPCWDEDDPWWVTDVGSHKPFATCVVAGVVFAKGNTLDERSYNSACCNDCAGGLRAYPSGHRTLS